MSNDAAVCNELSRPACLHSPQPSAMAGGMIGTRAGRIASREIFTHTNLSADLRKRSLAFGTSLGAPRYVVHARSQRAKPLVFDKIFTLWNELDEIMWNATNLAESSGGAARVGRKHAWQTGYVRELQVRRMVELARAPTTSTYCEVRCCAGHTFLTRHSSTVAPCTASFSVASLHKSTNPHIHEIHIIL